MPEWPEYVYQKKLYGILWACHQGFMNFSRDGHGPHGNGAIGEALG